MKALNLHGIYNLIYEDVEAPVLKNGEVLVKIKACGICSSDVERVFENGTYHFPTIPGHEFAGEIVEVAEGVDTSLIGKRTSVFPLLPCFECDSCKKEAYAMCANYKYFGSRNDGGFAEYLAVPVWNLVLFDDTIPYEVGALCEPAAVSLHAVNMGNIKPGDKVAVMGTGTIGILIGVFAKLKGATVYMCGRRKESLDFVETFGLNTINIHNLKEEVDKITDSIRMDVCFEAVGSNSSMENAIMSTRSAGTVVAVGNPKEDFHLQKDVYWKILRWQLTLKGTWNSFYNKEENDWEAVTELMKEGDFPFEKLVSKTYRMDEYNEAFEYLRDKSISKSKVMFVME
ncbi:MAG: galactitol-1-phosphate 5-dehydrogenase [Anaerovoracaceae bacterium]